MRIRWFYSLRPPLGRLAAYTVAHVTLWVLAREAAVWFAVDNGFSLWFPASGVDVAMLFIVGPWILPSFALVQSIDMIRFGELSPGLLALYVAVHLLAYGGTARVLLVTLRVNARLRRWRDIVLFTIGMVGVAPLLVGIGKVSILTGAGWFQPAQFASQILAIWVGDATGVAMVAPPLLLALRRADGLWWDRPLHAGRPLRWPRSTRESVLMGIQGASIVGVAWAVFRVAERPSMDFSYLLFLPVLWASVRFGIHGAVVAVFALNVAVVAVVRPVVGQLPFYGLQLGLLSVTIGGVLIGAFVTERRRLFARLDRERRTAQRAARLQASLLANLSHEVRTPLTAVLGFGEALRDDVSAEHQPLAEAVVRGAERLHALLGGLLELSALESGAREVRLRPTPVDIIASAAEAARATAESKGLAIGVSTPSAPLYVRAEAEAVTAIVGHLVGNAVRFTTAGSVSVATREDGQDVVVEVADTGPGIAEAFLPRAFDAFEQASAGDAREHEGAGLGLTLARHLARLMDGDVTLSNRPEGGTVATLRLRRSRAPRASAKTPQDALSARR